ncbi:kinesin-like protein KIN-12C isoform X2 [Mercurialis annua]|uniref:kinesin-like protein KIN-12C isoform X2 n=1 Tax=Mercurialis annua TaxID=3986 RepID=UPI002160766F|nr:kinesin-like protein KIN-12C isoform X2 [Mercurialis annua]
MSTSYRIKPNHSPEEANENEFEQSSSSVAVAHNFPPPRTPLNAITDPSQYYTESDTARLGRFSSKKFEAVDRFGSDYGTPALRVSSIRQGRVSSEANSVQSTPAKCSSRVSLGGGGTMGTYGRTKGRDLYSIINNRFSSGNSMENSDYSVQVPHFELDENPSFWADHNVQVLIRIRPLSNMEKVSHGYGRCLKQESSQTLVWFGHPETRFTFDHIACETISQEKLFRVVGLPMVENCMSGYNSCMFAYGQTGSGKTHTMMGEINQLEDNINEDCGITPRIFEYLFSRIRMEEVSRRNEKLRFNCKCSFLEIYNEQITDLMEPSSTNLQLREDSKKGVYVENLTEYHVETVNDVTKLLLQGAANRKMAATNMNSESSRSHSVFTCIIESWWEKGSTTHFRFARLNLVDLAGSERQKSSGAEGDRLKEAANINKSLSTLGLVMMSLVDLAQGKHRHVPYRDSRLTFLLQDSLGGNSKTTIIANISPSMCSANETLSTLKFAQRAKLIQNNAKVNEDASGDVGTLQRQIQQLKDQLSFLTRHFNFSVSAPSCVPNFEESSLASNPHIINSLKEKGEADNQNLISIAHEKVKSMEATLVGALRREKMAEKELLKFEAKIELVNQFACQREEELELARTMLELQEAKNKHLEYLVDGSLPSDHFLMEENKALKEENQLLQARVDKIPQMKCFALDNLRLHEKLQVFQNFYEQGERETLLAETSELREQLLDTLERKIESSSTFENHDGGILEELEECRNINSQLMREVEELKAELRKHSSCTHAAFDALTDSFWKDSVEIRLSDRYSMVETVSTECDYGDEMALTGQAIRNSMFEVGSDRLQSLEKQSKVIAMEGNEEMTALQAKLEKLTKDLEQAKLLNFKYQEDQTSQLSHQHQVEIICEQVEAETTKTIIHLQEKVTALQIELNEKLCCMARENMKLKKNIHDREEEITVLCGEWENATFELTSFLLEGSKSLEDASGQIESIICSFPQANVWIREQVERATRACINKEEAILQLEKSLEDTQKLVIEMELKIRSLKEATLALNEFPQSDCDESIEESINLRMLLNEKIDMIKLLESQLKCKEDHILEAEKRAGAAFLVMKWLSDYHKESLGNDIGRGIHISKWVYPAIEDIDAQISSGSLIIESGNAVDALYMDVEMHLASIRRDTFEASTTYMNYIQDLVKEIQEMRSKFMELKENKTGFQSSAIRLQASKSLMFQPLENQHTLHAVRDELAKGIDKLKIIEDSISKNDYLVEADNWSSDYSLSSYSASDNDFSNEIVVSPNQLDGHTCHSMFSGKIPEEIVDLTFQMDLSAENGTEDLKKTLENSHHNEAMTSCIRKEVKLAITAFNSLYAHLTTILDEKKIVDSSCPGGTNNSFGSRMEIEEVLAPNNSEVASDDKVNHVHASTFICKFEEARETMMEADHMLNALLKANENAKELNEKWKQASEKLMVERSQLVEENEQLKASINLKDEENKLKLDEICNGLVELRESISLFEGCFLQMQRVVNDSCKFLFSDVLHMGNEMLHFICNSRSSLEDIFSEIMEKEFAHFVMHQCVVEATIHRIRNFSVQSEIHPSEQEECHMVTNSSQTVYNNSQDDTVISHNKVAGGEQLGILNETMTYKNLSLEKELQRKEVLLKGLHLEFSFLQEAVSKRKDIKDETQKLILALNEVRYELEMKTSQFDNLLVQYKKFEGYLADSKNALSISNSDLCNAKEKIDTLSKENTELKMQLKDLYLKKSEAEEQMKEQKEVVRGLEKEIIHLTSAVEKEISSSVEGLEEDLRKAADERDQLREEICSLNDQLEVAYALADEREAISVESRHESEASKLYAEQKEEEVKILEHSVEELDSTINVLEKKVYEMDEEVERHKLVRESLELELQALRDRLLTAGNFTDIINSVNATAAQSEDPVSRQFQHRLLELHEAHNQIRLLERDVAQKDEEIKQWKEYISELVLHSEAQASQYQKKYMTLEAMVHEVSSAAAPPPPPDNSGKSSIRTRGSSSPFRCISNLVQQMNLEKDQELSVARVRVQELEAMLASRQKEVCMLNARLAAAESMTHDVIRDLLGVKLDMTNYANLIDQCQVQRLLEAAHNHTEEYKAKEQETLNLKRQINDLMEEKESCILELTQKESELLDAQITLEQLQERDQLLSQQNEMLKMDKTNLLKKVVELDDKLKTLLGKQSTQNQLQRTSKIKEKMDSDHLTKKLAHSEKILSRVTDELAHYQNSSSNQLHFDNRRSSRR